MSQQQPQRRRRHSPPGRGKKERHERSRGKDGDTLGPCPPGIAKENMQAISAPYNFVPLAGWVHIPDWSYQVSHDLPFQDGFSGEICYTLTADSPLLVGGEQQEPTDDRPSEVRHFQLPNGRYAIPGASLKGMLRAVVEIAGFGRMRMVDDARPGLRDITGSFVRQSYTDKVRNKVKPGFLRQRTDGGQEIVPCKMVRLNHRDLENALDVSKPIFKARWSVAEKYRQWSELCEEAGKDPARIKIDPGQLDAQRLFRGQTEGIPVFTGQISDSTTPKGKQRDFVFYKTDESQVVEVTQEAWRDFLHIHGDKEGKPEMSWPGYWKRLFRQGQKVPVFYAQERNLLRIGLAYMPKLAGDFSIHDMIGHSSEQHCEPPGLQYGYDLADLLFGAINGDHQEDALRGRVSCETAIVNGSPEPTPQPDTILNGPKPTYFPNYITQDPDPNSWKLRSDQYATYMETQQSKRPTLRGFKRYPTRPEDMTHVQQLTEEQKDNKKVQVRLHTLPAGTTFTGRIVFHNLKPEELGTLLWALTWGSNPKLRHGLGMGKPFGFGQVRIRPDYGNSRVIPNDPAHPEAMLNEEELKRLVEVFEAHMEKACSGHGDGWWGSPQIANLLAMADPEAAQKLPAGMALRHMLLMRCKRNGKRENLNEFQWAKQQPPGPFVLADYGVATGHLDPAAATPPSSGKVAAGSADSPRHPWLLEQFSILSREHNITDPAEIWGGQPLAKAWSAVEDPERKSEVLREIETYWRNKGWWENPPKGAKRRAKQIYDQGSNT